MSKNKVMKAKQTPLMPEGHSAPQLPAGWARPFDYLIERVVRYPEIAAFPAIFLAALNNDPEALKRVFVCALSAYEAAKRKGISTEERCICNALVWLSNQLAESKTKELEAEEAEARKVAAEAREAEQKAAAETKATEEKARAERKAAFVAAATQQEKPI